MRSFPFFLFIIGIVAVGNTGCAALQQQKWLSAHRSSLRQIQTGKQADEQKLDGLIQDYVLLMQEGLRFVNPIKGAKYIKKYHDQNLNTIETILQSTEKWQSSLNTVDALALGIRTVKKPYVGQLIELAPKFKQKYKQYAFAVKLTTKVTGGLTKFAGKKLLD